MIQEIIMHQAVCDRCGKVHVNPISNAWRWKRKEVAFESATSWDWIEIDNKLYCPECVKWDTETKSYKPKEKKNTKLSNSENIGKNLKPFDLEAAKAGKPVCTRDGRKARIICFDRKANTPIVALIECGNRGEILQCVHNDGRCVHFDTSDNDLMMFSEKKEGWVNVYKRKNEYICENECSVSTGIVVYKSEGEAKRNIDKNGIYVNTIKITWEE